MTDRVQCEMCGSTDRVSSYGMDGTPLCWGHMLAANRIEDGPASSNRVRVAAQAYYDSGSAFGWGNLSPEGQAYWMRRVQVMLDALDAIPNRVPTRTMCECSTPQARTDDPSVCFKCNCYLDPIPNRVCICGAPLREGDWFRREVNKPDECSHATRNHEAEDVVAAALRERHPDYKIPELMAWDIIKRLREAGFDV